jgi:toxin ParE1/3/4
MSSRRPQVVLTKRAQRDYRRIQAYTLRHWGPEQAARYMADLDAALEQLRDHPYIGPVRFDLRTEPRCFPVNHHLIYYRIRTDVIEIAHILHERTDPAPLL